MTTPAASAKDRILIAAIGDEDTITGLLLAGIGNVDNKQKKNFLVVDSKTQVSTIEAAFQDFTERKDIAILLVNQHIAEKIRPTVDRYEQAFPALLEIPSKDHPYVCMKVLYCRKQQNVWIILSLVCLYLFVTSHVCLYSTYVYDAFVVNLRSGKTLSYLGLYHRPIIGADYLCYWAANMITESLIASVQLTLALLLIDEGLLIRFSSGASIQFGGAPLSGTCRCRDFFTLATLQSVHEYDRTDKRNYKIMVLAASVLLIQNVISSGMIAARLWYMGRLVSSGKTRFPYRSIVRAVIESAALYSTAFLALVISCSCKMFHASDIVLKALSILVGIVPTLMWFSTNFKLTVEASRARHVTAKGDMASTDLEEGQTYTEWRFAKPGGASDPYIDAFKPAAPSPDTTNLPIPQPLFFSSRLACESCRSSSSSSTALP
ncbi:H(+)-transporting V1 sector ATPase subunit F [Tulasnella sp. 427]|nr:H(+)-transporting V1 sector ATPase subunit F [Tulasnella sp. 427]